MLLSAMAHAFKIAHPQCESMTDYEALAFYNKTYGKTDSSSNERSFHFTAFRMAFLDDKANQLQMSETPPTV